MSLDKFLKMEKKENPKVKIDGLLLIRVGQAGRMAAVSLIKFSIP